MGRSLADSFPEARAVFEEADEVLGWPLSRLLWQGDEAELRRTENAQPALLVHSVAALRVVEARGLRGSFAAGHSLGEYSAHVAAGSLTFADALRLVRRRGELMARAGEERPGTMAAILGLDGQAVAAACAEVSEGIVVPANYNGPGQVVISGTIAGVEAGMASARARGAKRVVRLDVSGAFHSPLMEPAAAGLAESLALAAIREARFPVVANLDASPVTRAEDIRDRLARQLLGAVRWEDSMRFLLASGVTAFVELGTGKVLRGLLRQIEPTAKSVNVDDAASLEEALASLGAGAHA